MWHGGQVQEAEDAKREAEECRNNMQVEMAFRQKAEQVTAETQNRLEAEKQARRLAERKLEETKRALKAEQVCRGSRGSRVGPGETWCLGRHLHA